jgi:hypothetical protein
MEATPSSLSNVLEKTKQAVLEIKEKLEPVLQRLKEEDFGDASPQAQASVALSIGMMRYMGARLRGLDQGRAADDPLRQELNKMKKLLAEIKKQRGNNNNSSNKQKLISTAATSGTNSSMDGSIKSSMEGARTSINLKPSLKRQAMEEVSVSNSSSKQDNSEAMKMKDSKKRTQTKEYEGSPKNTRSTAAVDVDVETTDRECKKQRRI